MIPCPPDGGFCGKFFVRGGHVLSRYYPNEFIQEIKQKANLVEIASLYTKVVKMGVNYLAICPFHDDKKPSMQIKPETNTFYCHACGAGSAYHSKVKSSDVISFIRGIHNFSFNEAIEFLAQQTNTPLPPLNPEEQQKYQQEQQWKELCFKVNHYLKEKLKTNEKALSYLANRGITNLEIDIWQLGFGEDVDHPLFKHTLNRITFPIFDLNGQIVSFSGRVPFSQKMLEEINKRLIKKGKPTIVKYLDQKDFNKGNHLYGIHLAKEYIREWKSAVIVEGYTDVISMHRSGAHHTVSTMGTALTKSQIQLLKRCGAENVIIMTDADEAGIIACERNSQMLTQEGIKTFVIPLPFGLDPDDLCYEFGYFNNKLSEFIEKYMQPVEQWKIHKIFKETQDEIMYHYSKINDYQSTRLEKVIPILATIHDPVQLDLFIRQTSDLFVISYDAIKEKLHDYKKRARRPIPLGMG